MTNYDQQQLEETRALIAQALAIYQPQKSSAGFDGAMYNLEQRPSSKRQGERITDPLHIKASRSHKGARLNCSDDVFEHLRVQRVLKSLPSHLAKWLIYKYGESSPDSMVPELVSIVEGELPIENCRKPTKAKIRNMVFERLTRREFVDCLQRNLFEAIGVKKQTYFQCYAKHNDSITDQFQALDELSLRTFQRQFLNH